MAAALTTASYSFTDEEVSRLAKCDDQPEFLLLYRRLLQSKGIDPTAVFDAQTTLSDYGSAVLPKVFKTNSHAMHLEVAYAHFKSCNSSSCLKLDSTTTLPTSWLKEHGVNSVLPLPKDALSLFTIAGLDLHEVRSLPYCTINWHGPLRDACASIGRPLAGIRTRTEVSGMIPGNSKRPDVVYTLHQE